MADTRSIDRSARIHATAEAVWKALTEADELVRWFAPEARVSPGPDGRVFLSWGPGMEGESRIAIWDPPRHLRIEFGKHPSGMPLYVDFFVGAEGEEAVVRLVHSGFAVGADWDEEYDSHGRGWAIFLDNLTHYLERHAGQPCRQSIFMRATDLTREEAWDRFVARSGLERDGDTVRLTTPAGQLAGRVGIFAPARDLTLTVPALADARLNLSFERSTGGALFYGVLLSYGLDAAAAEDVRRGLQEVLDGIK